MEMTSLAGQVAVITGAGSGIGKAIALALGSEGVALCLMGRSLSRLEEVKAQASSMTSSVRGYEVDLASEESILACVSRLRGDVARVDLLVHCAGVHAMGRLDETPAGELDRQYRVNLRAPYLLTQEILPMMRPHGGQIVFMNSSAGSNARGLVGQYAATKHGLKAMADSLRDEVNAQGIRVTTVFAGRTATPMQEAVHKAEGRVYAPELLLQPQDVAAIVLSALRLPGTGEVTEIRVRPMRKL